MAVKPLSALVGQNNLPRLAPDLTYPEDHVASARYIAVQGIDASGALTTVLSLTGKFSIEQLYLQGLIANDVDQYKLTIDGVVIWNESSLADNATAVNLLNQIDHDNSPLRLQCDESFLFEMKMTSDTSIDVFYRMVPIL